MNLFTKAGAQLPRAFFYATLALAILLIASCSDSPDSSKQSEQGNIQSSRGNLVAAMPLSTVTTTQTNTVFQYLVNFGIINASASYDVKNYKISYQTTNVDGQIITASGLLSIPVKEGHRLSPIISHQNGTIFLHSDAPSNRHSASSPSVLAASLGYIVSSPDYIGFGDSRHLTHPYAHSKTLASSSIDMLRAAKVFLQKQSILSNEQLFLMGYSQGGKATLAMHREIEEKFSDEFQVTASVPGAGNYDMLTSVMTASMSTIEMVYPAYVAWIIKSYNEIYQINRLAEVIAPAYLDIVRNSFDDTQDGDAINAQLTNVVSELINPAFLSEFRGDGALDFKAAFADASTYDWKPIAPLRLFHGQDDRIVFYANSMTAFEKMLENGATSVQVVDCDAGANASNHANCFFPYLNYVYSFFAGYANDL